MRKHVACWALRGVVPAPVEGSVDARVYAVVVFVRVRFPLRELKRICVAWRENAKF